MESKRAQILKYLEDNPAEFKKASEIFDCSIQYVYRVRKHQSEVSKRGKRSKLTNELLALTINEIGFEERGTPTVWTFKILKKALANKGVLLSASQLTRIMHKAGFSSKTLMSRIKQTGWYKSDKNTDEKEARKFRNTILLLDVIENKKHLYAFMSMRGELFLIERQRNRQSDIVFILSAILVHFEKNKKSNKLIIVARDFIKYQSKELKKYLSDNKSRLVLKRTSDISIWRRELLPDPYKSERSFYKWEN